MLFKYIFYIIGLALLALGITLTLISDLGAGGWDALMENLYKATDIRVGTWVILIAFILLIIAAVIKKEFINYRAFLISVLLGKMIDFFYYSLNLILRSDGFIGKVFLLLLLLGLIFIGVGCAMMFVTHFPKNHTEAFVFSVVDTTGLSYQRVKTTADVTALLIAVLIGFKLQDFSNLGLGTVLSSFFMGTIIQSFIPLAEKGIKLL